MAIHKQIYLLKNVYINFMSIKKLLKEKNEKK